MRVQNSLFASMASVATVVAVSLWLASAAPASAQATADYQLPPAPERTRAPVAGPVDDQNPVVLTPRTTPTPVPDAVLPPPPVATEVPGTSAAPGQVQPRTTASPGRPAPDATRASPATAAPSDAQDALPGTAVADPDVSALPSTAADYAPDTQAPAAIADAPSPEGSAFPAWIWAMLAALVAAIALIIVMRRRAGKAREVEADYEPASSEEALRPSRGPPAALPEIARQRAPEPAVAQLVPAAAPVPPAFAVAPLGIAPAALEIVFEPRSLQLSVVNATLAYRLVVRNVGGSSSSPFVLSGDMISAHASLGTNWQLNPEDHRLAVLHRHEQVGAGDEAHFTGQLRLALADVTPLRINNVPLLAPLARFVITLPSGERVVRLFTFGQPGLRPDSALVPFRLDAGMLMFRPIEARAIEADKWLDLDPVRRAS